MSYGTKAPTASLSHNIAYPHLSLISRAITYRIGDQDDQTEAQRIFRHLEPVLVRPRKISYQ